MCCINTRNFQHYFLWIRSNLKNDLFHTLSFYYKERSDFSSSNCNFIRQTVCTPYTKSQLANWLFAIVSYAKCTWCLCTRIYISYLLSPLTVAQVFQFWMIRNVRTGGGSEEEGSEGGGSEEDICTGNEHEAHRKRQLALKKEWRKDGEVISAEELQRVKIKCPVSKLRLFLSSYPNSDKYRAYDK